MKNLFIIYVLDCLEHNGSIPLAFCYVPQMDQMNSYKQYKKSLGCKPTSTTATAETPLSRLSAQATAAHERIPFLASAARTPQSSFGSSHQLMTISEFLLAASPPANFREYFTHLNENSSSVTETGEHETFVGPRLTSSSREPNSSSVIGSGIRHEESHQTSLTDSRGSTPPTTSVITKASDLVNDVDIGDGICNDIWEHLCCDKLWETVVDYYYSLCATTTERKNRCFQLKGIEIVNPVTAKLADVLLFKMQNKHKKIPDAAAEASLNSSTETGEGCSNDSDSKVLQFSSPLHAMNDTYLKEVEETDLLDVKCCLSELVDKICLTENPEYCPDERTEISTESSDSVLLCSTDSTHQDISVTALTDEVESPVNNLRKSKIKKKTSKYVDVATNKEASENLSRLTNVAWTIDHDVELISYLVSQGKETENFTLVSYLIIR